MSAASSAAAPKVALVIGSGGVKCAAALGVKRVLERHGIEIDLVVGCSGGSILAALIALEYPVDEAQESMVRLWTRDLTSRPDRRALLRALRPRLFGFDAHWGMRDDRLVVRRLEEAFGGRTIEDTPTRLLVTATDFETGEQVCLDRGSIPDAIRGSIAIPFIFPPWPHEGRLLVDGYLSDPLPVGAAVREGATTIVALGFEAPYQEEIRSAARFAFQVSSVMTNNLLRSNFAFHNLAHHGEVLPIIPRFERRVGLFSVDQLPYVVDTGEEATEAQIDNIRASIEGAPAT